MKWSLRNRAGSLREVILLSSMNCWTTPVPHGSRKLQGAGEEASLWAIRASHFILGWRDSAQRLVRNTNLLLAYAMETDKSLKRACEQSLGKGSILNNLSLTKPNKRNKIFTNIKKSAPPNFIARQSSYPSICCEFNNTQETELLPPCPGLNSSSWAIALAWWWSLFHTQKCYLQTATYS